jgi:hypothetical protein
LASVFPVDFFLGADFFGTLFLAAVFSEVFFFGGDGILAPSFRASESLFAARHLGSAAGAQRTLFHRIDLAGD